MNGETADDNSGFNVAAAGDVNGDGYADFIIGAPGTTLPMVLNGGNNKPGKSYVVFGRASWGGVSALNLNTIAAGTGGFLLNGWLINDHSGFSVSAAGDINADGYADLILGAPVANSLAGKTYVVFGRANWSGVSSGNLSVLEQTGSGGFVVHGESLASGTRTSGFSVSPAGDINGDGFADFMIGAPLANNSVGKSYIVFGGPRFISSKLVQGVGTIGGTVADEVLVGSSSADVLTGGGGVDRFFGGVGNDSIVLTSDDINNLVSISTGEVRATIDGGAGIDTLRLSGGANLDLTAIANIAAGAPLINSRISSIERIDLATDSTANTLSLTEKDVLDMAGMNSFNTGNGWNNVGVGTVLSSKVQKHQLAIVGGSMDTLNIIGSWTLQSGQVSNRFNGISSTYNVYNSNTSATQLLVDTNLQVPIFVSNIALGVATEILNVGHVVTASVSMNIAVTVSGIPQLALTIGNQVVAANYVSGSGSSTLIFTYNILIGQFDANGISIAANSLTLNNGAINGINNNVPARLTHLAVADNPLVLVDAGSIRLRALGSDGFVLNGEANTGSGYGVTTVGDINGDGFADFMISAFGAPYSRGKSYVVFGKANWSGISAVNLSAIAAGSGGFALNDEVAGGNLNRHSGSAAGDINGDGLADFIVGASDVWGGTGKSGKSYVVFGRQNWSGVSTLNLSVIAAGSGGFALNAEASSDENGYSVASAGDVNGDGYTDFIIGARHANNGSIAFAGESYVVFGKANWSGVSTLNLSVIAAGSGGFVLGGESPSDDSGTSVASAGDINGDGLADLIVAAPRLNPGTSYVIFGRSNWSGISAVNLSTIAAGSGGFVLNGGASGGDSMISVASAGDINGDGYADVIIGGYSANNNTGTSYVVFGKANWSGISAVNLSTIAAGSGGFVLNGERENDHSGYSLATAGDINGDGYADFIVGAKGANSNAGKSYVVFGKANWSGVSALNLSLIVTGSGGFVVNGEALGDNSGFSVSPAGDINGDGFADLIIGAKGANSDAGKSYIIFGGARFITSTLVQGSGTVTGSASDEVLVGSAGADVLTGGGGVDRFFGGAGNDTIVLTSSDISNLANVSVANVRATVDGGTGINTLRLSGGANLDLTAITNIAAGAPTINSRIASIEGIDLATDSAANTLTLSVNDVLDMAGMNNFNTGNGWDNVGAGTALSASVQKHQLLIDGTVLDVLRLTERWILQSGQVTNSASGSVKTYKVYNSGSSAAQLLVDNNIQTQALVQNIALATSPNILSINNVVTATVTMDGAVNVNGTPQLGLTIGNQQVAANYASGSASSTLIFTYTLLARQFDANGVSIAANSLTLNGGTINTVANGLAAVLIHDKVTDNAGVLVDSINIRLNELGNGGVLLTGEAANDRSGFSVATAGDINGDGFADFIIGAYDSNSSAGKSYVVFGKANWSGLTAVNLNTVAAGSGGFALIGETASDRSGFSVAVIGDINGDSYSDFIVGGYSAVNGAGKSYVVFGKPNWSGVSTLNLSTVAAGSGGFVLNGEIAGANSGYSVATAGDINGDGYADLIIGAKGAGKSYVVFGRSSWSGVSALNLLSTVAQGSGGFVVNGEVISGNSVWSVATAGDINGDGYADLMIGAKDANSLAGKTYVVFGKANWSGISAVNLSTIAAGSGGFVVNGEAANDNSASSVATVGDINGDGYADFIIGAKDANSGAGKSYVVFGKGNWSGLSVLNLSTIAAGTGGFVLNGETANDNSGNSVAAIGDINADGYADFIVGARAANKAYVVFGRSNWSGVLTLNLNTLEQNGSSGFVLIGNTSSNLGRSVSVAGDINGDGYTDLIVGAPNLTSAAGQSYIIFGGARFISAKLVQGSGTVTGTVADEAVVGSSGADVLTGGGGVDRFFGGANDDTLVITSSDFNNLVSMGTGGVRATIDGGTGIDTLRLSDGANLNLTAINNIAIGAPLISNRINSIERIDLATDSTANTLSLTENDVLEIAGMNSFNTGNGWNNVGVGTVLTANVQKHQLAIVGGSMDTLNIIGAWTLQSGQVSNSFNGVSNTYNVYHSSTSATQLLVDANLQVPVFVHNIALGAATEILNIGNVVTASVTMNIPVTVSGIPQLALTIGSQVVTANYVSGSGSSTLIFTYSILVKQFDANGISIAANSLTFNNGTINGIDNNVPARLTHLAVADNPLVLVDAVNIRLSTLGSDGFVLNGEVANDNSGYSVATVGDINSDGFDDIFIGLSSGAGKNYVVFGNANWSGISALNLSRVAAGSGGFVLNGETTNGYSGRNISVAGDVNGDGVADFIVGSPYASGSAGKSYVVFGRSSWSGVSTLNLSTIAAGSGGFALVGEVAESLVNFGDHSGWSVSTAGDVNGDGFADLIIGATADSAPGADKSYVVFGRSSWNGVSTLNLSTIAAGSGGFVLIAEAAGDKNGWNVASAGDINGDSYADLIVSATGANNGAGKSYVVFGRSNWSGISALRLSSIAAGSGGFVLNGEAASDDSGTSVSTAGDINGDGYSDFIVGANDAGNPRIGKSYVVFGKANWSGISALNLSLIAAGSGGFVLNGEATQDAMGYSVATAGDINGDGFADLIVGAFGVKQNTGTAYVVFGRASWSGISALNLGEIAANRGGFLIKGEVAGDFSSSSVSPAGDINGDGFADLIIGAKGANSSAGKSYIIFGGARFITSALVKGSGTVTGSAIDEVLVGSAGADVLTGGGGVDRFFGGAGNDTIVLTSSDISNLANVSIASVRATVDGGTGIDTLRLSGGADLDLTSIANIAAGTPTINSRIASIERIDLATDSAANTLTLSVNDVLDMADMNNFNTGNGWSNVNAGTALLSSVQKHQLLITGTALDTLSLIDVWQFGGQVSNIINGISSTYNVYNSNSSATQLLVSTNMQVPAAVQSISLSTSPNLFTIGNVVTASVTMNVPVTVSGIPQLALTIGNQVVTANYVSGSGGLTLIFTYTILARQFDGNGISIAANSLTLNNGTINEVNGGTAAKLTHNAVADNPLVLVDAINISLKTLGNDGLVLTGEVANNAAGLSVATAGDINGDGLIDFIIGATGASSNKGKSYVVFGKPNWSGVSTLNLSVIAAGSGGFVLNGEVANAQSGGSVSVIGDINGDGYSDFIIGASYTAISAQGDPGKSYVVFGKSNWSGVSTLNLSEIAAGSGGFVLNGQATGDHSGWSVSTAGDVNGDGYADFIIGAHGANSNAGKSYVVFGKPDWSGVSTLNLSEIAAGSGGFVLNGESSNDNTGWSIATAGDVNGDGYADFMVGAKGANSSAGKSYVVFGKPNWSGVSALNLSVIAAGSGGFVLNGVAAGDNSGYSVATAGDINGDGYADFIIGAKGINSSAGKSYVVFGKANWSGISALNLSLIAAGSGGFVVNGETASDNSGYSVATAGDINADGYADFIVGARGANSSAGKSYVVFGRASWSGVSALNLGVVAQGSGGFVVKGEATNDSSGNSVATASDVNGDGFVDLIVGAPGANSNAGKGYIIFGGTRFISGKLVQASGTVTGTVADEVLVGSSGADVLTGEGGVDRFFGGAGNDTIVLTSSDISHLVSVGTNNVSATVDGGTGINTLRLIRGANLDLTAIANVAAGTPTINSRIANIERIDLATDNNNNILTLSSNDVLDMTSMNSFNLSNGWSNVGTATAFSTLLQKHQLLIDGTGLDTLKLTESWMFSGQVSNTINGVSNTYNVYNSYSNTAQILVDSNIQIPAFVQNISLGPSPNIFTPNSVVTASVTMNIPVTVSGTPQLALTIGNQVVIADYASGSGSSTILFTYTILTKQFDSNGISIAANSLTLNNGAINGVNGGSSLTHGAMADNASVLVDGINIRLGELGNGGVVLDGEYASSHSGTTVAPIGDINGDGFTDSIIGTMYLNGTSNKNYVVFGRASWSGVSALNLSTISAGNGGFVLNPETPLTNISRFSSSNNLSGAGDINNDGLADFIVGDSTANVRTGKSYVVFGRSSWSGVSALNLVTIAAGTGGFALVGENTGGSATAVGDYSGFSVSTAGDINGDGFADFIIGAPEANSITGKSYLVFGRQNWNGVSTLNLSIIAAGSGGFVLNGEATYDYSGFSVSTAGDINGDGFADLIIGAYYANGTAGKSYVVFGKANWSGISALNLNAIAQGSGGFVLNGEANDISGDSVSTAGDINGDGFADFIIGAPGTNSRPGKSYVVFGKANWSGISALNLNAVAQGSGGFVVNGEENSDFSGTSVATAGDINGDGYSDFIIGATSVYGGLGKSYVVFGKANWSGISQLNLNTILATGSGGFVLIGEGNSSLGKSVSAAGDMNGDGYADLIVGASNGNGGAGKSYIIFGGPRFIDTALVQASGVVTGTSADEAVVGSSDADVLTGGGGVDRFFAGAGNDTIVLSSSDISNLSAIGSGGVCATVDGGTGIDTLRLSGGANLNLTAIANIAAGAPTINSRIASIERIDLATDSAANTLTLSVNDVLDMAGMNSFNTSNGWSNVGAGTALGSSVQKHQLLIDGTALDTVIPIDGWIFSAQVSNSVGGISKDYNVYTRGTSAAQLLVGANIQVPVFVRNISFSTPADILTIGNVVTASITMSVSVTVSGIPQLALTIGNEVVAANYASGSGSSTLIFTYTILAKQFDTNGISVAANSLSLNNGNINGIYNVSSTARLEHGALADNASLAVDAVNIRLKALGKGGIVLNGEVTNDNSGDSVALVGDINGDGYGDFIIGAKAANNSAGKSYVVFGRANWSGLSTLNLSTIAAGSGGFVLNGEATNDKSGISVALAGDINGDSYSDFIVSATGANHSAGKSYVVFGRANWSGVSTLNLSTIEAGSGGFVLNGKEASDNSGISVSTAGDINGDGYTDFIIGAYYAYVDASLAYAGKSYVVFGRANWSGVSTLNLSTIEAGSGGFVLNGEDVNDQSGTSVATAGDINGDGYSDFIIGASGASVNGGKSYVVFGRANWSGVSTLNLSTIAAGSGGFVLNGEARDQGSGWSIASAGDINGDGYADFMVGTNPTSFYSGANKSYVIFGRANWSGVSTLNLSTIAAGSGGFVVNGESSNDYSGYSIATAGDINGDGYSDFIIGAFGASQNTGASYVVFGRANWSGVSALNLSTLMQGLGSGGFVVNGAASGDNSGASVSAAGDINGDGFADLMVGSYGANNSAGKSYIIFGGSRFLNGRLVQGSSEVTGTNADEALVGSSGADVLTGGGGVDRFFGGAGNDIIVLTSSDISNLAGMGTGDVRATVDGGAGMDTLRLRNGANLDLTAIANIAAGTPTINSRIANIERIDLTTDTTANSLTLAVSDVLDMAGMNSFNTSNGWSNVDTGTALGASVQKHQLVIDGTLSDRLNLRGGWTLATDTVNSSASGLLQSYKVYNSVLGNAQLLVDADIVTSLL